MTDQPFFLVIFFVPSNQMQIIFYAPHIYEKWIFSEVRVLMREIDDLEVVLV